MTSISKISIKMKVFPKGQVVIPVSLRKKYKIDIGDHVNVIPSKDGILLQPSSKKEPSQTLTDNLFGIFKEYAKKRKGIKKRDIIEATEKGFSEGWGK